MLGTQHCIIFYVSRRNHTPLSCILNLNTSSDHHAFKCNVRLKYMNYALNASKHYTLNVPCWRTLCIHFAKQKTRRFNPWYETRAFYQPLKTYIYIITTHALYIYIYIYIYIYVYLTHVLINARFTLNTGRT